MLKAVLTIDKILQKLIEYLLLICVFAMVLLIIWQVVARYILYLSVPYAEELARLSIVWCIFAGASLAIRTGDHIYVEVLLKNLPLLPRTIVKVLIDLLIFLFAFILVFYGKTVVNNAWIDHTTSIGYTRALFYLPLPIFGTIMCLYSLANCVISVASFAEARKTEGRKSE